MVNKQPLAYSGRKRQAILDAALVAFKERGVDNSSMDYLAARAGVSKRTVYNHFPSKARLVRALVHELSQRVRPALLVRYDGARPLNRQLLTLVGAEIELLCDEHFRDLARVAVGARFSQPDLFHARLKQAAQQDSALLRWIEAAVSDGRLRVDDPGFAAARLRALLEGSCFWPQVLGLAPAPDHAEQRRIAEEAVALFLSRHGAD